MVIKNGLVFTEENTFLPLSVLTQGDNITSLVSDDTALPASENDELVIEIGRASCRERVSSCV